MNETAKIITNILCLYTTMFEKNFKNFQGSCILNLYTFRFIYRNRQVDIQTGGYTERYTYFYSLLGRSQIYFCSFKIGLSDALSNCWFSRNLSSNHIFCCRKTVLGCRKTSVKCHK